MKPETTLPKLNSPLQRQMTITLSLVIVSLLLLVGVPMVLISVQIQRRESDRAQQEITNQVARSIADIIQTIQTNQTAPPTNQTDPRIALVTSQITTGLNLAASRTLSQIKTTSQTDSTLDSLLAANPQIQGAVRYALDGTAQDSAWRSPDQALDPTRFAHTTSFEMARQGIGADDVLFISPNKAPALIVAGPIQSDGTIVGVVIVWVDAQSIWQSLTDLKVGETGYLYIINQEGKPIIVPAAVSPNAPTMPNPATTQSHNTYQGLSGKRVVGHVAPVENTPWQVVTEIPLAEANASLRSLLIILGAILLFGLSLATTTARIFSGWLLQPIQTLHQSALRISQGDLAHRIELDRDDELGFLASAFNQMVATLEKTIDNLRTVSRRLLSAEEAERQRIAHEIHDELGQTLTALRFSLSIATRSTPNNPAIEAAQKMAAEAQEKARTLSHELRPAMLDDLGLLATLEWYIDRVEQRDNLAISLDTSLNENALPTELKTTLYRLVVEALTNISKHAHASAVEIVLAQSESNLHLRILDDGQGFDTTSLRRNPSLGIAGMRERVNLLRGDFSIESQTGKGTTISIVLPL